jgi:APA family basic amino acid/polyamine antiporter
VNRRRDETVPLAVSKNDCPAVSSPASTTPSQHLSLTSATLLIVANMIGVGVFTMTGQLLGDLHHPWIVLGAWALGGVVALAGALSYAELGAALPKNGGEYHILSRAMHPALGCSAAVSALIVGFSAPTAAMSKAFGLYLMEAASPSVQASGTAATWLQPGHWCGAALVIVVSVLQALHLGLGTRFQDIFSAGKMILIAAFVIVGLSLGDPSRLSQIVPDRADQPSTATALATGLVFISFAYTGWNAAVYLSGEVRNPSRTVPLALILGTGLVMILYVGLNAAILCGRDAPELIAAGAGVSKAAAEGLFGQFGGRFVSGLIALGLVSTVSAQIMTGPRVYEAVGHDYPALRWLTGRKRGGPIVAIVLQAVLTLALLFSATFNDLLRYIGSTLSMFSMLVVASLFVLRLNEPDLPRPYVTWGYPITPLVYLVVQGWTIVFFAMGDPSTFAASLGTIAVGVAAYFVVKPRSPG